MPEQAYVCMLCMRQCPLEALGCGQGRRAAQLGSGGIRPSAEPVRRWEGKNDLAPLLERCGRALLHRGGLGRGQTRILEILSQQEGTTQKRLQEMLGVKPGSISEILSKLESKHLILRGRDSDDRRTVTVKIAPAGRDYLRAAQGAANEETAFAALSAEEQTQLKALLLKLQESWDTGDVG